MFRKVLIPSAIKLSGARTFTRLTKSIATRIGPTATRPLVRSQDIRPQLLNSVKISPYAFLHTQSTAPATAVAELVKEQIVEDEPLVEPIPEKKRFADIKAIHPNTQKAIRQVFKYKEMSAVQDAVLSRLPNKKDMFVKAKTGTGKTLAFLTAAIETAVEGQTPKDFKHFEGTSIMVISPTRELANQIADEAEKLVSAFPFKVHCMVGGDSKRRQILNLQRRRCDIVVATPGRLHDMLTTVPNFKKMCQNLKVLVLDEADQLLDMGFKAELQRILNEIPEERQTMLYSATMSREIRENLGKFALSPDYELIDTVGKDDVNTNIHVKQSALVAPYQNQCALIRECLETHEAAQKGKVIVFLPTTKATMVYANIFRNLLPDRMVYEIHSKKAQDQRSRIADRFRKSKNSSILFTSDVSARGVDYPGVSLVLQVGVPSSREQYIHRLGRTGRAGREGEGIILLAPFEKSFLKNEVSDLPIQTMEPATLSEQDITEINKLAHKSLNNMDEEMIREVYTAYLGYYSGRMPMLGQRRSTALDEANKFMEGLGVTELPYLSPRFLAQLGLNDNGTSRSNNRSNDGGFRRGSRNQDRGYSRHHDRNYETRGNFRNKRSFDRDNDRGSFNRRDSYSSNRRFDDKEGEFKSRGGDNYSRRDGGFHRRDNGRDEGYKRRNDGFKSRDSFDRRSSFSHRED
ncbi:hypothetical protein [Parasitella parasitica]|uniref:ATP-dependent RNA helicase n=1 Tax=Parasitella parasitica TaxID=35722 RepID=A0A0B7NHK3_9FUNG|nr:hypothetical protein [Parasitella parasitica]